MKRWPTTLFMPKNQNLIDWAEGGTYSLIMEKKKKTM